MLARKISGSLLIAALVLFAGHSAMAIEVTYTDNSDFAQGILEGLNHKATPDQLQLNSAPITFKFINVAASKRIGRGTLVRINAETGEIMGEYWTAPQGYKGNPSRTSVDSEGNVWTANRDEDGKIDGVPSGSVVKIGLAIGGTRVSKVEKDDDGDDSGLDVVEDPLGQYLAPPFDYATCIDRDGDGLIKTSRGLGDVLDWKDGGDSQGGTDGLVTDADDECILLFQRLPNAANAQHVSVDANDDVWVGGYPGFPGFFGNPAMFHKLDGDTAAVIDSFDASLSTGFGCGGFGGLVDENGILWSASQFQNKLLQYNPADGSGSCINVTYSYGLAESVIEQDQSVDVFIWNSSKYFPNQITKIDAFTSLIQEGFPISTVVAGDSAGFEDRGVAFTPADRNIWVAKAGAQEANEVRRFNSHGNLLNAVVLRDPVVPNIIGRGPTGLAVDGNGKVWVVNQNTNNVMRIDPAGNDGRGLVDLTIALPGAAPECYGDMAGEAEIGTETASLGTWTVITDGGAAGTMWDSIAWNTESEGNEREGATITVEAQAADSEDELNDDANYEEILNGELLSLTGRYIKIRATLQPDADGTSPVLSNLVVKSFEEAPGLVCDVDENGSVDIFDILGIFFTIQDIVEEPNDLRDWDSDGVITLKDVRGCVKACARPFCIPVDY
ncbi:MAG: hypothetical protein JSW26_13585 [Desulfobacterales bacterium]|nr:MAG: hypothetical protein JSW26_13585 [Desulfobacterales bacterium]